MNKWTNEEIAAFDKAQTLHNRPYNDDKTTSEEDNPVWEVTVDNQVFIRGAKGIKEILNGINLEPKMAVKLKLLVKSLK